jgi:hypothetical protein
VAGRTLLRFLGARRPCPEWVRGYPEISRYLAQLGIDSIGVNPSSNLRTMQVVTDAEGSVKLPHGSQAAE